MKNNHKWGRHSLIKWHYIIHISIQFQEIARGEWLLEGLDWDAQP